MNNDRAPRARRRTRRTSGEPGTNRRQRDESDTDHEAPAQHSNGAADDDAAAGKLMLTASQEQAVGIRIETPLPLTSSPAIDAYATVLDPVALLSDAGHLESTRAGRRGQRRRGPPGKSLPRRHAGLAEGGTGLAGAGRWRRTRRRRRRCWASNCSGGRWQRSVPCSARHC